MKDEYPPRRASERHNRFLPLRLCSSGTKAVARMWRLRQMTDTPRQTSVTVDMASVNFGTATGPPDPEVALEQITIGHSQNFNPLNISKLTLSWHKTKSTWLRKSMSFTRLLGRDSILRRVNPTFQANTLYHCTFTVSLKFLFYRENASMSGPANLSKNKKQTWNKSHSSK